MMLHCYTHWHLYAMLHYANATPRLSPANKGGAVTTACAWLDRCSSPHYYCCSLLCVVTKSIQGATTYTNKCSTISTPHQKEAQRDVFEAALTTFRLKKHSWLDDGAATNSTEHNESAQRRTVPTCRLLLRPRLKQASRMVDSLADQIHLLSECPLRKSSIVMLACF